MIVYTFKIHSLTKRDVNSIADTVISTVWEKTGIDEEGHVGIYRLCTDLDTSQVGISTNYISYNDLTESDILSWIGLSMDMNMVDKEIDGEIEKSKLNEIQIESGNLPWDQIKNDFEILCMTKKTINDIPNTILTVEWKKTYTDEDNNSETMEVRTSLDTSQVGISSSYVDYYDLTEDIVKSWVEDYLNMDDVDNELKRRIEDNKNDLVQVASDEFPWKVVN